MRISNTYKPTRFSQKHPLRGGSSKKSKIATTSPQKRRYDTVEISEEAYSLYEESKKNQP